MTAAGGGKRGGGVNTTISQKRCDASDRGDATGNNQPARRKDERAAQHERQRNDINNSRLAAKAAGDESVNSRTTVCDVDSGRRTTT